MGHARQHDCRLPNKRDCRAILAALEYERQREDAALDHIAEHAKSFGGTPRGVEFDAFLVANGRPRAALTWAEQDALKKAKP